jgi:hypothetical protein
VAGVHDEQTTSGFYLARLAKTAAPPEIVEAVKAEIERGRLRKSVGSLFWALLLT